MVQCVDDVCDVLAHAAAPVPRTLEKTGGLIDEVRRENFCDDAVLISFVELGESIREETEGREYVNSAGLAFLKGAGNLEAAFAGGNHIVVDDQVLALDIGAKELMCDDRVAAVDNTGVVPSLVEHTDIKTQDIGEIDGSLHTAFVRADDHHVIGINGEILLGFQQSLDELIDRLDRLEAGERNCILDSRIMCVKGDNVVDAHADKLLKSDSAVERLTRGALMLTALIEERHDDGDAARLAADSGDDTLEVLIMVIR